MKTGLEVTVSPLVGLGYLVTTASGAGCPPWGGVEGGAGHTAAAGSTLPEQQRPEGRSCGAHTHTKGFPDHCGRGRQLVAPHRVTLATQERPVGPRLRGHAEPFLTWPLSFQSSNTQKETSHPPSTQRSPCLHVNGQQTFSPQQTLQKVGGHLPSDLVTTW